MTLWGWLTKKMNYVRSLWILHCRGLRPICPPFPLSDKTSIGMHSHWHSIMEVNSSRSLPFPVITVSSRLVSAGFSKRRASGEIRGEETIAGWLNEICIRREDSDNIRGSWKMTTVLGSAKKNKVGLLVNHGLFSNTEAPTHHAVPFLTRENEMFVPGIEHRHPSQVQHRYSAQRDWGKVQQRDVIGALQCRAKNIREVFLIRNECEKHPKTHVPNWSKTTEMAPLVQYSTIY